MTFYPYLLTIISSLLLHSTLHTMHDTPLSPADLEIATESQYSLFEQELVDTPAAITFATADIKYREDGFTLLECGNGPYSGLRPHPLLINGHEHVQTTPYWAIVEHALKKHGVPTWFVGYLHERNATVFQGQERFTTLRAFAKKHGSPNTKQPLRIADAQGIVVYRANHRNLQEAKEFYRFADHHPSFILVNAHSNAILCSKQRTYKLFHVAGLAYFVPRFASYPVGYKPGLAADIAGQFPNDDLLIIKPLQASRARGVCIVYKATLDADLQRLFGTDQLTPAEQHSIGYWRTTQDPTFLVTSFAPSKTIQHQGKPYQATMRITFLLTHEQGRIDVNIISTCWQRPPCSLDAPAGSLLEKLITNPDRHETDDGILVEEEDIQTMRAQVAPVLAQAYKTMLLQRLQP